MTRDVPSLIERARGGDEAARGELFDAHVQYLTLLARVQIGRRLQGKVDPDDVVQEAFLNAHRQFGQFRGTTAAELAAWLRTILGGQLALLLRRYLGTKGRDVTMEQELAVQLDHSSGVLDRGLAAPTSTPSYRAVRRENALLLSDALGTLPPDSRAVIVLRHLEQLSFADVAARMGRSEDSVQKLWVRSLGSLRKSLGGLT